MKKFIYILLAVTALSCSAQKKESIDVVVSNKVEETSAFIETLNNQWKKESMGKTPGYEKRMEEISKKAYSKSEELRAFIKNIVKENQNDPKVVAVITAVPGNFWETDDIEKILPDNAPYLNHPDLQMLVKMKKSLEKRKKGAAFENISIPDADGKMHELSEYIDKGKYVFVDFWASWCGPCCREMPNVVEAYKKHKGKNFEIIGISLDQNKEKWLAKVKELGMTWPQLSDLKGWKCEAATTYGIQSIPSSILFDPQGKVVANNLRGEELIKTLDSLLK